MVGPNTNNIGSKRKQEIIDIEYEDISDYINLKFIKGISVLIKEILLGLMDINHN